MTPEATTDSTIAADQFTILLNVLEVEITRVILADPSSEMAQNVAALTTRLLQRALVERTVVPQLRDDALASYKALLPQLSGPLGGDLYGKMQTALESRTPADWGLLERVLNEVGPALLTSPDLASGQLAGQLFAIDATMRGGKEAAWLERSKPAVGDEAKVTPVGLDEAQQARLLAFIQQCFPNETTLRIASVKQVPGGFSKLTMFINFEGNQDLPGTFVLRWDNPFETSGTSVTLEFPVIERMYAHGIAVPPPFACESSGDVLGRPFILLGRVAGATTGDFVVVKEPSREVALDLARQLARMHAVPVEELAVMLPAGTASPRERVAAMVDKLEAKWHSLEYRDGYAVTSGFTWLKNNLHLADGPRCVVHCDMGPHNYLVHENKVSAILDWEVVDAGTALEDIGGLYYPMIQMIDWEEFLQAYEQESGHTIDRSKLEFYIVWSTVRLATLVNAYVDPVFGGKRVALTDYYLGDYIGQVLIQRAASRMAALYA